MRYYPLSVITVTFHEDSLTEIQRTRLIIRRAAVSPTLTDDEGA
ncbi:type V toxin-antitoxin system endoribonuclease antitoxin GhoS [Salmonella enterica subsp. enterica]|nr:type V toxin-antitoxin system endoribonuclease antitoxin GhoS [Salmonella enterica subsp. enterica]